MHPETDRKPLSFVAGWANYVEGEAVLGHWVSDLVSLDVLVSEKLSVL